MKVRETRHFTVLSGCTESYRETNDHKCFSLTKVSFRSVFREIKSVTMILPINNTGIFIVTLGFSERLHCDFYARLKEKRQLAVCVHNDPIERFEHKRIIELIDFSYLINQKEHLFRTVADEDVVDVIDR